MNAWGHIQHSYKIFVGKREGNNLGDLFIDAAKIKKEITQKQGDNVNWINLVQNKIRLCIY